jgi:hypothetical protein
VFPDKLVDNQSIEFKSNSTSYINDEDDDDDDKQNLAFEDLKRSTFGE